METKLLSTSQAAEILGVDDSRVRQLILSGRLPSMQIGRAHLIKESDLALVSDRPVGRPKKEGAAEGSPPAQKRAIAAEQQRRWKGEQLTLPEVPAKKASARKAAKKAKSGK